MAENPGQLLLQGRLRDRLGFKGVIASDELRMEALSRFGSIGERAALALRPERVLRKSAARPRRRVPN